MGLYSNLCLLVIYKTEYTPLQVRLLKGMESQVCT